MEKEENWVRVRQAGQRERFLQERLKWWIEFQFDEKGTKWIIKRHLRTVVKGFDEKFYMYGVRQIITAALFSGEAVVSQSFIEVHPFFTDFTCHYCHIGTFHVILEPSLLLCSVTWISLPLALWAHTPLLWGRVASFRPMCSIYSDPPPGMEFLGKRLSSSSAISYC